MMATPHMVVGAAVGRLVQRPWLAYPAAFASHFLLDFAPHLDSHALFGAAQGGPTRPESIAGITDFLVGALVVGWVAARQPDRRVLIGAALAGVLMDLVEYLPPFGPWFRSWAGAAWLTGFHHRIQHNLTPTQWVWGVVTQATAVGLGLAVCLAGRRTRAG